MQNAIKCLFRNASLSSRIDIELRKQIVALSSHIKIRDQSSRQIVVVVVVESIRVTIFSEIKRIAIVIVVIAVVIVVMVTRSFLIVIRSISWRVMRSKGWNGGPVEVSTSTVLPIVVTIGLSFSHHIPVSRRFVVPI